MWDGRMCVSEGCVAGDGVCGMGGCVAGEEEGSSQWKLCPEEGVLELRERITKKES